MNPVFRVAVHEAMHTGVMKATINGTVLADQDDTDYIAFWKDVQVS